MVITFQVQIDPINPEITVLDRQFSSRELGIMQYEFEEFVRTLKEFGEYTRAEMYVDGEVYRG